MNTYTYKDQVVVFARNKADQFVLIKKIGEVFDYFADGYAVDVKRVINDANFQALGYAIYVWKGDVIVTFKPESPKSEVYNRDVLWKTKSMKMATDLALLEYGLIEKGTE